MHINSMLNTYSYTVKVRTFVMDEIVSLEVLKRTPTKNSTLIRKLFILNQT